MPNKIHSNLAKAKVNLLVHHPFFASLLLRRELKARTDIISYAVDKSAQIYYNPEWVESHSVGDAVFGLAHEVSHVMFQHFARTGKRNPVKSNRAQDAVINEMLVKADIGESAESDIRWPGAENMTWEQVYDLMPDQPEDDSSHEGRQGDILDEGEASDSKLSEITASIKIDVAQAATAAKLAGKLPMGIEKFINELLNPPVHWSKHLEEFMTRLIRSNDYSWARPNRRHVATGVYLPGHSKDAKMGTIVVVSDESGSIDTKTLQSFGGYFNDILEQCQPERVILLHVDSEVGKVEEFEEDDYPVVFKQYCGGGTDMTAAFRWCEAEGVTPDCMVFLTDMHTYFGEEPCYPVVWAATTDVVAPFGKTVKLDM